MSVFRKKNTKKLCYKSFAPWFFDNINASRFIVKHEWFLEFIPFILIPKYCQSDTPLGAPEPTRPPMCNIRHYIDLYNLCSHGFYWSVRLIKRNKNLCEIVQKVDLKTKKWQRQKELKSSFGIFYDTRHFCNSQNSIFTLKFKFIKRGNLKSKAVILFFLGITSFFSWNHLHPINTRQRSINCSNHLQQKGACASHDYFINETNDWLSIFILPTNPRCRRFKLSLQLTPLSTLPRTVR